MKGVFRGWKVMGFGAMGYSIQVSIVVFNPMLLLFDIGLFTFMLFFVGLAQFSLFAVFRGAFSMARFCFLSFIWGPPLVVVLVVRRMIAQYYMYKYVRKIGFCARGNNV